MFYIKESIALGNGQFWERAIRVAPIESETAAKRLCDRSIKIDNQPFVVDKTGKIVYLANKGKDYK